ncbi:MAG TPA: hypothetical protein VJ981_04270 [Gammaproteobacteria bacterium]|nr:hypothetical protein [Gammaproteobacteria bacterium]
MTRSAIAAFFVGIICLSLFASSITGTRYITDNYDINHYQSRGSWYLTGGAPYRDVFSEYPQLATYMFALPYAIGQSQDPQTYRYIFSLMMALCLGLTIILVYQLRPDKKTLAFLLLLPACLYFTHNRFDIVPSLFALLSLKLLLDGRFYKAFAVLAISVMFKWYALVLFPVYLSYCRSFPEVKIKYLLAAFALPVAVIVIHSMIWTGWKDFFNPYLFHLGRGTNRESIAWFFEAIFEPVLARNFGELTFNIIAVTFFSIFLVGQFIVAFLALFAKIEGKEKVVYWSVAAIAGFMVFGKYYSPQWILWIAPLLLLMPVNRKLVILIVLFDIFTYLEFPTTFRYRKSEDILLFCSFYSIVLIRIGILFYFFWHAFSAVRHDIRLPFSGKRKAAAA